jgi:uncharacterized protein YjbJ (UPF0337 family)
MGDRLDELKGNLKEGVGEVTGNRRLEAEGETEADTARAKRKTKGALSETGGSVKEGIGRALGSERLEAEDAADRLKGKAERKG